MTAPSLFKGSDESMALLQQKIREFQRL